MNLSKKLSVSVIMPVYNGESTLPKTLGSLWKQKDYFEELIIINDGSTDNSENAIHEFLKNKSGWQLIKNPKNLGLAKSYNAGLRSARGDLIVTLHQDVVLVDGALEKLTAVFQNEKVVAASHKVSHPWEIWNKYNFWEKCFFARQAGKIQSGIDGKFDGFRRRALLEAGLFDEKHFRSAGEDGDMVFKLKRIGKIIQTDAEIIHLHKIDNDFRYQDIIYKQKQYSEAQGALLGLGRIRNPINIFKSFFREILLIGLFIPYVQILAALLIVIYSFWYTEIIFLKEYHDKRILILPVLNVYLLLVSFVYSLKGFIYGKQKI